MGYFRDSHPGHEGYAIGHVVRPGCTPDSGLYRELGYPDDATDRRVELISAGCECGWRSPRFRPEKPTDWSPFVVHTTERDDKRVEELWVGHIELTPDRGGA